MTDVDLIARATAARMRAYAPYSNFQVGAAILADGEIFDGANVENASFGLTACAERNALYRAVLEGIREIEAVAIVTDASPPVPPCGMCLQSLIEFAPDPTQVPVILANPAGESRTFALAELIPNPFRPSDLRKGEK